MRRKYKKTMHYTPNHKLSRYLLLAPLFLFLFYVGKIIASSDDSIILLGICLVGVLIVYRINFELFILLTLIINHEFFYLAPREILGTANYQDLLYLILPLTLSFYLFQRQKNPYSFSKFVIVFLLIIFIGILTSTLQGQPVSLGLKAAKGYYLLLFYFVFASRKINFQRLIRLIVLTGILLMILNNLQYIGWGSLELFQYNRKVDLIRGGQLRFLMGDFFTIFAPLVALGAYLQQKQRWYLAAFLYMTATVFIQGQTRAVIFGLTLTTFTLLFLAQRIRLKALIGALVIIIGFVVIEPMLQKTFVGSLFQETTLEFAQKSGNVGIRYDTYDYYWKEISEHIVTGRGIWNDAFTRFNPEDMKYQNLHLSDIGITGFLFHTGLLGFAWLIALLIRVYRIHFVSLGRLRPQINYGVVGYFIFSLTTLATLNGLVQKSTIIYLALALTVMAQYDRSPTQTVTA